MLFMSSVCHALASVHCCGFVIFPFGILEQVWYLIVSIPDPCCLSYFVIRNKYVLLLNKLKDLNCGHVRKFVTLSIIFWTIY